MKYPFHNCNYDFLKITLFSVYEKKKNILVHIKIKFYKESSGDLES